LFSRNSVVRFQVLTAASMMFRAVFWNHFTRQYNPEDSSEQETVLLNNDSLLNWIVSVLNRMEPAYLMYIA
jgi:hypothetical protein